MTTEYRTSTSTTGERAKRRMLRGVELHRTRSADFSIYLDGTVGVPSASEEDLVYHVDLETESCECASFRYTGRACKHVFAATIYRARRNCRAAATYRERVLAPRRGCRSRCKRPATTRRAA